MKCIAPILFFCSVSYHLSAQTDTEFPKEFIMHVKLHNGMVTNFSSTPDQYIGGIQLITQYTLVKNKIRGGIIADGYYTGKKIQGAIGPTISFKLKTFKAAPFGSAGNLHINIDHLWGSNNVRLLGGGINADIGNKIVLGLSIHRDYNLNTWWFQNTLGLRISKIKKSSEL
ncbi:MAG: hypothetical protein IPP72_22305 [Chitinophagaceae bacterium]|nr:hypothetical protein [Chitinophagaceae bacterium]